MELTYIRIPLYDLYYIDNMGDIKNSNFLNIDYYKHYDLEIIKGIFQQLEWSVKNPNYDFSLLLPDLPFNNKDIYEFLVNIHSFMLKNKKLLGL